MTAVMWYCLTGLGIVVLALIAVVCYAACVAGGCDDERWGRD